MKKKKEEKKCLECGNELRGEREEQLGICKPCSADLSGDETWQ
jgi:hypothetical protein